MNSKICVSIGEPVFGKCLQEVAARPLVEIRLDLMKLDPEKIDVLAMQCRQWVATCRPGSYTERERTVLLSASVRSGAAYIDIEYESAPEYRQPLIDLAKQYRCKVIVSYHNFESTPVDELLNEIVVRSKKMGADRVKMAVTAQSAVDCVSVMSLYERHENLIAFAMGEQGKITRIAAPLLGADFTYASVDEAHLTAPGQLTASQLEVIYRAMGV